jgi:hypothetical protein
MTTELIDSRRKRSRRPESPLHVEVRAKLHEFVDSLTPDRLDVIAAWVLRGAQVPAARRHRLHRRQHL